MKMPVHNVHETIEFLKCSWMSQVLGDGGGERLSRLILSDGQDTYRYSN